MATAEAMQARDLVGKLIQLESRGPGDTNNAMRRISRRHGIEYNAIWSLRYRAPKRIWADVYNQVRAAYQSECERQLRKLTHELETAKASSCPRSDLVVQVQALVAAAGGSEG